MDKNKHPDSLGTRNTGITDRHYLKTHRLSLKNYYRFSAGFARMEHLGSAARCGTIVFYG